MIIYLQSIASQLGHYKNSHSAGSSVSPTILHLCSHTSSIPARNRRLSFSATSSFILIAFFLLILSQFYCELRTQEKYLGARKYPVSTVTFSESFSVRYEVFELRGAYNSFSARMGGKLKSRSCKISAHDPCFDGYFLRRKGTFGDNSSSPEEYMKDFRRQPARKYEEIAAGIYSLSPPRGSLSAKIDIVFVHGLQGDAFATWRYRETLDQLVVSHQQTESQEAFDSPRSSVNLIANKNWLPKNKSEGKQAEVGDTNSETPYEKNISNDKGKISDFAHWPERFLSADFPLARILALSYPVVASRTLSTSAHKLLRLLMKKARSKNEEGSMEDDFRRLVTHKIAAVMRDIIGFPRDSTKDQMLQDELHEVGLKELGDKLSLQISNSNNDFIFCGVMRQILMKQTFLEILEKPTTFYQCHQGSRNRRFILDIGRNGREILFITHSLGGLLVKLLLINNAFLRRKTRGIVFYGVPHWGSPIKIPMFVRPILSRAALDLLENNPNLPIMHEKFRKICRNRDIKCISLAESKFSQMYYKFFGRKEVLVPLKNANPHYGQIIQVGGIDHSGICKPSSKIGDIRYEALKKFIQNIFNFK